MTAELESPIIEARRHREEDQAALPEVPDEYLKARKDPTGVCSIPGCPNLTDDYAVYCDECERDHELGVDAIRPSLNGKWYPEDWETEKRELEYRRAEHAWIQANPEAALARADSIDPEALALPEVTYSWSQLADCNAVEGLRQHVRHLRAARVSRRSINTRALSRGFIYRRGPSRRPSGRRRQRHTAGSRRSRSPSGEPGEPPPAPSPLTQRALRPALSRGWPS